MADIIDLTQLSPSTWYALEQYSARIHYDEYFRKFIEPQWLAWLIELLKAEPDDEELFPQGKWATIQRMQQLLAQAAEREIKEREDNNGRN